MRTATLAAAAVLVLAAFGALAFAFHSFTSDPGLPSTITLHAARRVIQRGQSDELHGVAVSAAHGTQLVLAENTHPHSRAFHKVGPVPLLPGDRVAVTVAPAQTTLYKVVAAKDHAIASLPVTVTVTLATP